MAKVIGPDFVALEVRDLAASRRFYTELLGLAIDPDFTAPNFVTFATSPIPFAIREPLPGVDLDAVERVGWGVNLWLNCDDADALYNSWQAHGVPILKEPEDTRFGRRFICHDPDGYVLIVYQGIPLEQVRLTS